MNEIFNKEERYDYMGETGRGFNKNINAQK